MGSKQTQFFLFEERHAVFDDSRKYRYRLKIDWRPDLPIINFVGLNPSVADETTDDNTVAKLKKLSALWGYGGMTMSNLFAIVATDPKKMLKAKDPVGPENDRWLRINADRATTNVACWGRHGSHRERAAHVLKLLPRPLKCFKLTKDGHPWHPLYLPKTSVLIDWL